jgi:NitT/TauT family transport system substrate-binding protein
MFSIRKSFLAKALAVLLPVAAVLSPVQSVQAKSTVTIGTVVWIGYAPFYVADALDTYKKYGVKVKLVNFADNSTMPGALQGGSIDSAMLTYDMVIGAAAKGWPLQVALPIDYSNGGDAIVSQSSITTIKEMKGMKVAYNPLSPSDFLLAYALQSNGMSEADITPVHMSPESVAGAMASGSVPVGVTYQPSISTIVASGGGKKFHVLFSSRKAPGLITDVLVFKADYLKKHPKEVKAIIQGYLDALDYMDKHPKKAAEYIAKAMGVTPAEALEQLNDVKNPKLSEMMANFEKSDNIASFYTNGKVIGDILLKKGQIKKMPDIASTLDDTFVKALLAK